MQQDVIEKSPSAGIVLAMFWGFVWRTAVWTLALLVPAIILSVGIAFFVAAGAENPQEAQQTGALIGGLLGMLASVSATCVALRGLVGVRFGGYRLLLVRA